ncbi:Os06g0146200, partial [Oryza sativa Japonica Group]
NPGRCLPVAAIGKFSLVGRSSYGADDEGMVLLLQLCVV